MNPKQELLWSLYMNPKKELLWSLYMNPKQKLLWNLWVFLSFQDFKGFGRPLDSTPPGLAFHGTIGGLNN